LIEKHEIEELRQDYLQIRALELAPQVYVCGQLFEHDLKLVAKQGVRSIVNNRSDNESMGQPLSADLAKVAEELGMSFVHFPVDSRSITRQDVEAFASACDELERPLLLFSRAGARSTRIWEMTESMSSGA
jgi:sulfide:quinone oxidoreductase